MNLIEFMDVRKEYRMGEQVIVAADNVNFTIEEGEFVVILGPSGAGKSTILNLLGGMDNVTSGDILVSGKNIAKFNDKQLTDFRGTDVGFVFQFYNLIPALTVYENVALVKETTKNGLDIDELLAAVGLLERKKLFPTQISGGEQQRVSIARALAKKPKLLLCDEPTGALDSETGVSILMLLQKMNRENKQTVVIVTHNSSYAQVADKVIHVKNGKITNVIVNENVMPVSEVVW